MAATRLGGGAALRLSKRLRLTLPDSQGIIDATEVADSAHKHGVTVEDMHHAVRVPFRIIEQEYDGEERGLIIGADRSGRLLEVVVVQKPDGPVIIHADGLRPKFYDYM